MYSNQPEPEGINAQEDGRGQGREFLQLASLFAFIAVVAILLSLRVGTVVGGLVPFSWERALAPSLSERMTGGPADPAEALTQARLRALAGRVAGVMALPEGMTITVHLVRDDSVNAFATFGGTIMVFSGLLDKITSEQQLAALLAHEIAHVRDRHVMRSATGWLLVALLWGAIVGDRAVGTATGQLAGLPGLARTRQMERDADAAALEALVTLYGNAGGYFALFALLDKAHGDAGRNVPMFLQSHPDVAERVAVARQQLNGRPASGPMTPWPTP